MILGELFLDSDLVFRRRAAAELLERLRDFLKLIIVSWQLKDKEWIPYGSQGSRQTLINTLAYWTLLDNLVTTFPPPLLGGHPVSRGTDGAQGGMCVAL